MSLKNFLVYRIGKSTECSFRTVPKLLAFREEYETRSADAFAESAMTKVFRYKSKREQVIPNNPLDAVSGVLAVPCS
jgi:hypothetical protein